jgi:hypothetical protein
MLKKTPTSNPIFPDPGEELAPAFGSGESDRVKTRPVQSGEEVNVSESMEEGGFIGKKDSGYESGETKELEKRLDSELYRARQRRQTKCLTPQMPEK